MPDYILRIEGQNFDDTVFNTNDLSTIRGSSLCLEAFGYELDAAFAKEVKERGGKFERLYAAAAQAVFRLCDMNEARAEEFGQLAARTLARRYRPGSGEPPYAEWKELENWGALAPDEQLRYLKTPSEHMTFAIAREVIGAEGERAALNRALWRNRRQQMQQPNLPPQDDPSGDQVCPIDPNRFVADDPEACGAIVVGSEDQFPSNYDLGELRKGSGLHRFFTSRRSADLRTYGRDARRTIYAVTLGSKVLNKLHGRGLFETFDFSQSFADLIADPPQELDLPASLQGKLGFLYFDGTGFGEIRKNNDVREFARTVEKVFRETTQKLLTHFMTQADPKATNAYGLWKRTYRRVGAGKTDDKEITRLRLETLMCGGEDLSLVVPAWLAWDIAWRMLDWLRKAGKANGCIKEDMIFRAGLLICDAKTPARRATAAAHAICEDAGKHPDKKRQPVLGFHIVEGFDVPETHGSWQATIGNERREVFGTGEPCAGTIAAAFRLSADEREKFENGVQKFKADFARSQLYRLLGEVEAWYRSEDVRSEETLGPFIAEKLKLYGHRSGGEMDLKTFHDCLPGPDNAGTFFRMKLLAEVWDYIALSDGKPSSGESQ